MIRTDLNGYTSPNAAASSTLSYELEPDAPRASDCISAVISAEGDFHLAAERVFGTQPNAKARLIATIAADQSAVSSLAEQLRTFTLLQAFQTARLASVAVDGTIDTLHASDRIKLYIGMLQQVGAMTEKQLAGPNQQVNIFETVFNSLPREIQDSVKVLMAPAADDTTLDPLVDQAGVTIEPVEDSWLGRSDGPPNAARDIDASYPDTSFPSRSSIGGAS